MNECKICKIELKNKKRLYCSNKCKFLDKEYNKSRISTIKNDGYKQLQCKICDWKTLDYNNKSGVIGKHLQKHNINFNKFDYIKQFNLPGTRNPFLLGKG